MERLLPGYRVYRDALKNQNTTLREAVGFLNQYKDQADGIAYKKAFSPQTKFHSTVMEEFWALAFSRLVARLLPATEKNDVSVVIGPATTLQNIVFAPQSPRSVLVDGQYCCRDWFRFKTKDRDCVIGVKIDLELRLYGRSIVTPVVIPLVSMEAKQYLDKTMLDNAISAARHLHTTNPYCLEIVAIELSKLADTNVCDASISNIYCLRKQHLKDAQFLPGAGPTSTVDVGRRNPICWQTVTSVCRLVSNYLQKNRFWNDHDAFAKSGFLFGDA